MQKRIVTTAGVGKLTSRLASRTAIVVVLTLAVATATAADSGWQPVASIAAAAEHYLLERTGQRPGTTVRAGALDPRLRLARCAQPLEAFLRRGTKIGARTIVGVRCNGGKPWKVYVPVDVVVTADVLTAKRTLSRGHIVVAADLVTDERDVSRMNSGYLSDPDQVVGQRLKTTVLPGRVITPAMVEADNVIRRGQSVTLVVESEGININMAGKALTDGALNQRIRVENVNSGRVVEGIVRSREHVEVLVPGRGRNRTAEPKVPAVAADTKAGNNDR